MSFFTISELSREFGVTLRALRFYEDQGLINPRRQGKNRYYSKRDRVRLRLTLRGRRLGLTVKEIAELFELYDTAHNEHAQLTHFLAILDKRKAELEQKREDIDVMLSEITSFEKQCRTLLENRSSLSLPLR